MANIDNPITVVNTAREEAEEKDINFYDYDGFRVESWTFDELATKTELPANPTHEGLVADGWNWTLQEIKDWGYEADVGQCYKTSDNKTHIFVKVTDITANTFCINVLNDGSSVYDWGDGETTTDTASGYHDVQHSYLDTGVYEIKAQGHIQYPVFSKDSLSIVTEMWLSSTFDELPNAAMSVEKITVPNSSGNIFSANRGSGARSLKFFTVPRSATYTGTGSLSNWGSLARISISPKLKTISGNFITSDTTLKRIIIPGATGSAFGYSSLLSPNTVQKFIVASGITAITNVIFSDAKLNELRFLPATPPTLSSSSTFGGKGYAFKALIPYDSPAYLSATNYPSSTTYVYLGFGTFTSGTTLPTQTTDATYNLTWYASIVDGMNQQSAITTGNGKEVYCRYEAVS